MNAPLPLQGMGVVITRPKVAAEALAASLARAGARPFVFPALAIEPLRETQALEATLARLVECDVAIFISANAVEHGLAAARRSGPWPAGTRVAAVGEVTAKALRNSGFQAVISPRDRHDSEGLLACEELKAVAGRHILIFRGQGGRELLKAALESRGAHVSYAECYRRMRPAGDPAELLGAWSRGDIHAVSVLSAETLENFVSMIGPPGESHLESTTLVVPHEAVAARPLARRFAQVIVAPPDDGMVAALAALRIRR
jgi:uroporphyrinogen-III synthase